MARREHLIFITDTKIPSWEGLLTQRSLLPINRDRDDALFLNNARLLTCDNYLTSEIHLKKTEKGSPTHKKGLPTHKKGLCIAKKGLRTAFLGLRIVFSGLRTAFLGLRTAFSGLRTRNFPLRQGQKNPVQAETRSGRV